MSPAFLSLLYLYAGIDTNLIQQASSFPSLLHLSLLLTFPHIHNQTLRQPLGNIKRLIGPLGRHEVLVVHHLGVGPGH